MSLKLGDLTDPAAVQSALDEYNALGQQAFLDLHGFRKASGYVVRNPRGGEWADSKAIAGVALGYQFPGSGGLQASAFSGGAATVQRRLQTLGFEVRRLADAAGSDWTRDEVALLVADYLSMLVLELNGQRYNKAIYTRQLLSVLPGRPETVLAFMQRTVSAALLELGFPYLKQYPPRYNLLSSDVVDEVSRQVARRRDLDDAALQAVQRSAATPTALDFSKLKVSAPAYDPTAREEHTLLAPGHAIKRDYFAREAHNRSLGSAGEEFALRFERWRLQQLGAGQLAEAVKHVAVEEGDGLGYDILSFEPDGGPRYIEVKTTSFGERTPFFVSANELRFSKQASDRFHLYRLFDFRASPRMFELAGPVDRHCLLDPASYRARFS